MKRALIVGGIQAFLFLILLSSASFITAAPVQTAVVNNMASPVGYWKQIDDKTGQVESVLQIWQSQGQLYGKVVQAFPIPGQPFYVNCTKCSGSLQNAKIVGMTVLSGFQPTADGKWENGRILDPTSGKIYKCTLALKNNGQSLDVHGYIGISLLGRSQTWVRTTAPTVAA